MKAKEENEAAVKIQSIHRRKVAKKVVAQELEHVSVKEAATLRIQSLQRGRRGRKDFAVALAKKQKRERDKTEAESAQIESIVSHGYFDDRGIL